MGHAGAPLRPTARVRPAVPVRLITTEVGVEPSDPYVRRFWVAALGPGAVAELLRLISAAGKGEEVRLPRQEYFPHRTDRLRTRSNGRSKTPAFSALPDGTLICDLVFEPG
ncbi:MAG TPA: hypothetical protein VE569_03430 [Acidimicrobiia bacterium]|nr:hypothetical protein [Acidimicrobiia bacterium]